MVFTQDPLSLLKRSSFDKFLSCLICRYLAFFSRVICVSEYIICFIEMYKCFCVELNCAIVCHLFSSKSVFFPSLFSHFVSKCIYNWCHFFQDCAIKLSFSLQFPSFEVSISEFLMYFLRSREELFEGS